MVALFVLVACIAGVMSTPSTPTNETLRELINPSPELIKELNDLGKTLKSSPSFAAALPELAANSQLSNLNLVSSLTDLVRHILSGLLNRGQPSQPSQPLPQPVPTNPPVRQPMPFNPFSFMFPGGGNPMSMLYPGMMFNMMDGLFEGFF